MAQVSQLHLAHTPSSLPVFAALFKDVKNAAFLREQLLAGNKEFEYAFVDAQMILSVTQILAAVFRAINDLLNNRLRSRNVHSEVVLSLSPNNNIAESFRRFGVTETTTSVIAIKIGVPSDALSIDPTPSAGSTQEVTLASVAQHLTAHVHGTPLPFHDRHLLPMTNLALVRKTYKLNAKGKSAKGKSAVQKETSTGDRIANEALAEHACPQEVEERSELQIAVLAMMALKGS